MSRFTPPSPGTCRVCGCTEDNACPGGCSWVDRERTLCSDCEGTPDDLAYSLRWVVALLNSGRPQAITRLQARQIAMKAYRRHERYECTGLGK